MRCRIGTSKGLWLLSAHLSCERESLAASNARCQPNNAQISLGVITAVTELLKIQRLPCPHSFKEKSQWEVNKLLSSTALTYLIFIAIYRGGSKKPAVNSERLLVFPGIISVWKQQGKKKERGIKKEMLVSGKNILGHVY